MVSAPCCPPHRFPLSVTLLTRSTVSRVVSSLAAVRGAGTASYQIEGGVTQGGRESSIWDVFSHTANKTAGGQTGDTADDSYNLYPADIELMRAMDLPAFRFSLSWSRLIHADGSVNQAGIDHYNAVIDALLAADIEPYVTLYHWDLPTAYSSYVHGAAGDWLNASYIVPLFEHYADVAFGAFGDRVKNWLTFNEPLTFCFLGYENGQRDTATAAAAVAAAARGA